VVEITTESHWPKAFESAVANLSLAATRREIGLIQIPAPKNLASHSIAFAASVESVQSSGETELSSGRFVLLHEPRIQPEWNSFFRVVCFAKSPIELDIADDHLAADVAWGWITSSLRQRNAEYAHAAGTATRVISSGYGSLAEQTNHAELELRASWSPQDDHFGRHLEAWQDLVCLMGGQADPSENVTSLSVKSNL
jgi:hypothetical protein